MQPEDPPADKSLFAAFRMFSQVSKEQESVKWLNCQLEGKSVIKQLYEFVDGSVDLKLLVLYTSNQVTEVSKYLRTLAWI